MPSTGYGPVGRRRLLGVVGASALGALAGCTGGDDDDTDDESTPEPEHVSVSESATWRTTAVTDVTTDEEFRIADAEGPVVLHTFARSCATCQAQHDRFDEFYERNGADVEIVDLTIGANDDPDAIRGYAADDDFNWRFGSAPGDVMDSLISDFGREVTSSAASPVIVDCPDGEVYRAEKIVEADGLETILEDSC